MANMTNNVKFTYDQDTKTLKIADGNEIKVWKLDDKKSEIFYYILKAIDILDDSEGVASWAQVGNEDKIPIEKLDINIDPTEADHIPVVDSDTGSIPVSDVFGEGSVIREVESEDEDAIVYTFVGGGA